MLFDFQFSDLYKFRDQIFKLIEEKLVLNTYIEYKLSGIIAAPSYNHYSTIIFNPMGSTINSHFTPNYIYYHDGMLNNGKIMPISEGLDWKTLGIPYIVFYKNWIYKINI